MVADIGLEQQIMKQEILSNEHLRHDSLHNDLHASDISISNSFFWADAGNTAGLDIVVPVRGETRQRKLEIALHSAGQGWEAFTCWLIGLGICSLWLEADFQVAYTQKSRKPKDIRYDKDSIRQRKLQLQQALEFPGLLGPSAERKRNWSISRTGRRTVERKRLWMSWGGWFGFR